MGIRSDRNQRAGGSDRKDQTALKPNDLEAWLESRRLTPADWQFVRIMKLRKHFYLRTYIGGAQFGPVAKKVLLRDPHIATEGISLKEALRLGKLLEKALAAIELPLRQKRRR